MRRLVLLLLLAAVPALAALGPRYGGVLRVGVASTDRGSLGGRLLSGLVDATLVEADRDGTVRPSLAEGWGSSAGGREWTLRLAPGARFHDGTAVTAADVVRSLRRFLRAPGPAPAELARRLDGGDAYRRAAGDDLPGVTVADARSVTLRLVDGAPAPLILLAAPEAAVRSASGAGAGPFAPQGPARFTAFVEHVGGRPFLDAVELQVGPDPRRLAADLQGGLVDAAVSLAAAHAPSATLLLLVDPAAMPSVANRAALDRALDRAELVRHLLPGSEPARLLLPPTVLPDIPEAAERTAVAPVPGRHALAVSTDVPPLVSQRVLALLLRTGVQVDVVPTPAAEIAASRAPLRLLLWSPAVPDAGVALRELLAWSPSAAASAALAAAEAEGHPDRRRTQLYAVERELRSASTVLPLALVPAGLRHGPGLHDVRVDGAGRPRLDDAWREP